MRLFSVEKYLVKQPYVCSQVLGPNRYRGPHFCPILVSILLLGTSPVQSGRHYASFWYFKRNSGKSLNTSINICIEVLGDQCQRCVILGASLQIQPSTYRFWYVWPCLIYYILVFCSTFCRSLVAMLPQHCRQFPADPTTTEVLVVYNTSLTHSKLISLYLFSLHTAHQQTLSTHLRSNPPSLLILV